MLAVKDYFTKSNARFRAKDVCLAMHESIAPHCTMVLLALRTREPLMALMVRNSKGPDPLVTRRAPVGPVGPDEEERFQAIFSEVSTGFGGAALQFTVINLCENSLGFVIMRTYKGETYMVNKVNVLKPRQAYTVKSDKSTERTMIIKGKTNADGSAVTVDQDDQQQSVNKEGSYFSVFAYPEMYSSTEETFKNGTVWRVAPYILQPVKFKSSIPRPLESGNPRGGTFHTSYGWVDDHANHPNTGILSRRDEVWLERTKPEVTLPSYDILPIPSARRRPFGSPPDPAPPAYNAFATPSSDSLRAHCCSLDDDERPRRQGGYTHLADAGGYSFGVYKPTGGTFGASSVSSDNTFGGGGTFSMTKGANHAQKVHLTNFSFTPVAPRSTFTFGDAKSPSPAAPASAFSLSSSDAAPSAVPNTFGFSNWSDSSSKAKQDVGSTQVADIAPGDVHREPTKDSSVIVNHEARSEKAILGISIGNVTMNKNTRVIDYNAVALESRFYGKPIVGMPPNTFKSDVCIVDLESAADTVIAQCGHQCLNHRNTASITTCPICRENVVAFIRAEDIEYLRNPEKTCEAVV